MVHIITYWWETGIEPLVYVYATREAALKEWSDNVVKIDRFIDDGRLVVGRGHGKGSIMISISYEVPKGE